MPAKRKKNDGIVFSSLRCPKEFWEQVGVIAEARRLSRSQVIVTAIEEYCRRELPKVRP